MLDPHLSATVLTVADIFSNTKQLQLPFFQREYAWQREHVERLLADLLRIMDGDGPIDWYPLGTIILYRQPGMQSLAVADGHQRLMTLTILLAILRDNESDATLKDRLARCISDRSVAGRAEVLRLRTLGSTQVFFQRLVQTEGATRLPNEQDEMTLSGSEEAIVANRDWLNAQLADMPPLRRQMLAEFLLEQCHVVAMQVDGEGAARLLFATMHEAGLRPESVDLFKAKVLGAIDEEDRGDRQVIWETVEARLGHEQMARLFQAIAVIGEKRVATEPTEVVLTRRFALQTSAGSASFVDGRVKPLGFHLADVVHAGLREQSTPGPVYRRFQFLGWVNRHDTWSIPLLHWLDRHAIEDERTLTFVSRLEALAWCQMIRAEDVHRRDMRYLALLDEIDSNRALGKGGVLEIGDKERKEVRDALAAPNFTKRPYRLFLLMRANATYEVADRVTTLPVATIEHIYPQKPAARSGWSADFGTGQKANRLRHLLGNLTLLTEREQNEAKNNEFTTKLAVYGDSAFAVSRRLIEHDVWLPELVERRTLAMIDELMRSWGLD